MAIRIEFTGFVNEVKPFDWGTVYRMSHNQQQKNDQGQWETTGRDYFDVIGPAGFVESNRVTVKGTLKTKLYDKKDGSGKGVVLQVRAESMEHAVSNSPAPVQSAPQPVQQVWPEVAEVGNAPF